MTFTSGSIGTTGTIPATTATLNQPVTIDFSALTQFVGNNTIVGTEDGNAAGTLKSIQIDSSGTITGVYTNGVRQAEAQVAVAQFTNASGLTKGASLVSGEVAVTTAEAKYVRVAVTAKNARGAQMLTVQCLPVVSGTAEIYVLVPSGFTVQSVNVVGVKDRATGGSWSKAAVTEALTL